MNDDSTIIFIVDDDPSICSSLTRLISSIGFQAKSFTSAQEFLQHERPQGPCCLVLDIRLPGLGGLDLQDYLNSLPYNIPIIFITGYGSVPMSVRAIKHGAVDFLEKPFEDQALLDAVQNAIEKDKQARHKEAEGVEIQKRIETLTPREREVFALVVTGMMNKQIAAELGTSEKTVKVHRARVMNKMQVASLAELVRMAGKVNL